eukprot:IDg22792t1
MLALMGIKDWPTAVNWLLRTYATNKAIQQAVDRFRQIRQRDDEDDLAYFNRFEEAHAMCGEYLPPDQLLSMYIESVDERIRPFLREAREDRRQITILDLCRKAANQGETLQRKSKSNKDSLRFKDKGVIRRSVNTIEGYQDQQVHMVQAAPPAQENYLQSDYTSDLPTDFSTQTEDQAVAIDAEALAVMQHRRTRRVPPLSKGNYPFDNPGWVERPLGVGAKRGSGPKGASSRPVICWRCYEKGHIATSCSLDYDTRSEEVIQNYEALTFEELGQVPPGAYFRLKQLVTAENSQEKGLLQLIP